MRKQTSIYVGVCVVFGMGVLLFVHATQIRHRREAETAFRDEATRIALVWQRRAPVCDRYGTPINATVDALALAVNPSRLRDIRHTRGQTLNAVEREVSRLAIELWGSEAQLKRFFRDELRSHLVRASPMPFILWRDLDDDALQRWLLVRDAYPGITLLRLPKRMYHSPELAPLTRGRTYLTRRRTDSAFEDCDFPDLTMAGWFGVEKACDPALRGRPGLKTLLLDAILFRQQARLTAEPLAGSAVRTTLDMTVQTYAQDALQGLTGAIVVMRVDGEILALANHTVDTPEPALDDTFESWQARLRTSPDHDLNRCLADETGPGSLMKLAVALAALEHSAISPEAPLTCNGSVRYSANTSIRCHRLSGHGPVNMIEALRLSCNPYFLQLAATLGPAPIIEMMTDMGLGRRPGEPGISEDSGFVLEHACRAGVIYSPAVKQRAYDDPQQKVWRPVDTGLLAIGQADMRITPLQAAVFVNCVVTGRRVVPRLLLDRPPAATPIRVAESTRQVVMEGMRQVVHHRQGTGRRARVPGTILAGKTGTYQRGVPGDGIHDVWMVIVYPGTCETARLVIAAMAHGGRGGGKDLGPRLATLITRLKHWERHSESTGTRPSENDDQTSRGRP